MAKYEDDLSEEQKQARDRVHALLSELGELIGPKGMMQADGFDDEEEFAPPPEQVFLGEWVMVLNWIDAATGESTMTRLGSENLLIHHRTGLLFEGLYSFED